jgi:hypothetical protein
MDRIIADAMKQSMQVIVTYTNIEVTQFGHQPQTVSFMAPGVSGPNYPLFKSVRKLILQSDVNLCLLNQMFLQCKELNALDMSIVTDETAHAQIIEMIGKYNVPINSLRLNVVESQFEEESSEEEKFINLFSQLEILGLVLRDNEKLPESYIPAVAGNLVNLHTLEIIAMDSMEMNECLRYLQPDSPSTFHTLI